MEWSHTWETQHKFIRQIWDDSEPGNILMKHTVVTKTHHTSFIDMWPYFRELPDTPQYFSSPLLHLGNCTTAFLNFW